MAAMGMKGSCIASASSRKKLADLWGGSDGGDPGISVAK
jgi:hypothetical protein